MPREYYEILKGRAQVDRRRVVALDLETLITDGKSFLSGERIIAISLSYHPGSSPASIATEVRVAEDATELAEADLLKWLDGKLAILDPEIIIGYNHTGYDIPLIQGKTRTFNYGSRPRNILFYFGTAWCLDMMYVVADDLWKYNGDYYLRKLDDVVVNERYAGLPLKRVKNLVRLDGKNKGEAIKHLWENERDAFVKYCEGDTHDILAIFDDIFS
ncbi:MAG: hypothetical protein M1267_02030 [Candidatus Thermoplasmatota archaeon]|jgi:hypothetical protein|nr:hypothetical protein [Candidatus Thermoplasmatota archaeon]MCL5800856.1 hypothetical protein [Candidatus Thermoplasmatota archaeon]